MSLPDQVEVQGKLADELQQQLLTPQPDPESPPAPEPAAAPAAPVAVEPEKTPDAAPVVSPDDTWERRFKVLQGKYNAEVPALHKKVKELEAKITEAPAASDKVVKQEDVEQYGEEFIAMVKRAAREEFGTERQQLLNRIAQLEGTAQGERAVQSANAEADFFAALGDAHPDWEAINEEQKFLRWLALPEPRARRPRQQLVDEALAAHDSKFVIDMLSEWKALNKSVRPPTSDTSPAPATPKAEVPVGETKKTWTRAEMNSFYARWSKGEVSEQEAERIEAEINAAVAEGRVR